MGRKRRRVSSISVVVSEYSFSTFEIHHFIQNAPVSTAHKALSERRVFLETTDSREPLESLAPRD